MGLADRIDHADILAYAREAREVDPHAWQHGFVAGFRTAAAGDALPTIELIAYEQVDWLEYEDPLFHAWTCGWFLGSYLGAALMPPPVTS